MATRFKGGRGGVRSNARAEPNGLGDWWAAIAVMALATVALVALTGGREPRPLEPEIAPATEILTAIEPAERSLAAVESAFATLCREPVLLALELEPDCETGIITISESFFDGPGSASLRPEVREDVVAALRSYLARIRRLPALWDSLDAIEIRGHSDPRAVRDPYVTNLVGSQQRPLGVLLFLVGPDGLSQLDRDDLQRLAIVSAASYSRPPDSCPEQSRECYPEWRRVEIRPILSESLRRDDWSRTLEGVRVTVDRLDAERAEAPR